MNARQILGSIVLILLVLFVAFNFDTARVWFFGIKVEMPIGLVVIVSAVMGAGSVLLLARLRKRSRAG